MNLNIIVSGLNEGDYEIFKFSHTLSEVIRNEIISIRSIDVYPRV